METGPGPVQVARVETLLEAIHDMVLSLSRLSRQLGVELPILLQQSTGAAAQVAAARTVELLTRENAQLKEALEGRGLIERAKGMLMAIRQCDEDAAFQLLVASSRRERRRVRDVAVDVIDSVIRDGRPDAALGPVVPPPRRDAGRDGDRALTR